MRCLSALYSPAMAPGGPPGNVHPLKSEQLPANRQSRRRASGSTSFRSTATRNTNRSSEVRVPLGDPMQTRGILGVGTSDNVTFAETGEGRAHIPRSNRDVTMPYSTTITSPWILWTMRYLTPPASGPRTTSAPPPHRGSRGRAWPPRVRLSPHAGSRCSHRMWTTRP